MTWNNGTPPAWFRRAQWKTADTKRNGVHYVGDDVVIGLTFATSSYDTFRRTATFENGSDGGTIVTGPGDTATLDEVVGAPKYSSTHAYGSVAAKFDASAQYVRFVYNPRVDQYFRIYLYATAFPSSQAGIVSGQRWQIQVRTDGRPVIYDNGANGHILANAIATNQWVRLEWRIDCAGQAAELKLFNSPDSSVATEEGSFASFALGPTDENFRFGTYGNAWGSSDIWVDNVVAAASTYPGPYDPSGQPDVPINYTVRNYYGRVVSEGTFDESDQWFRPAVPSGGWKPGWYRVYLTGPQTSTNFYDSYGVTNVCVVKSDTNFVEMPAGNVVGGFNGEAPDYVMKGVMGLGTSRLIVTNLTSPAAEIATAQQELALTQAYWTNTGTPDSERAAREPWCTFPNCDGSPAQLAGVTAVVAALYPDCKYYEGPSNEPNPNDSATATKMQAFAAAVHAGNASAKAIGPSAVSIHPVVDWSGFLDAGGGGYCDEISFHAYNAVTNGDMNLGKYTIQAFKDKLASYGLGSKPLWQTESVHAGIVPYGIYHPRRARKALMETLLFEQMGVPRERNNWWYDISHGFWDYPAWLENGDGSLEPATVLGRVLAEETWGKPYSSSLDFGTLGNAMYLGNVYEGTTGKCVVLMATSYMTGASVVLSVVGDSAPVTVVDGFGNETTMPLSKGRLTLPMTDVPIYVRLPSAATATVYRINNHSPLGTSASVSPGATTKQIDAVTYAVIADGGYETDYAASTGIAPATFATPPSDATLVWATPTTIERVTIWCGICWSTSGTLVDFDVETYDGSDWTTRKTVTKPTPPWFNFGSDGSTEACFQETFWDEQWVFDIELDAPVSCRGVRLNVREASHGGEPLPDTSIANGAGGGQGAAVEAYRIQEIAVTDANRYAGAV